jgi:hypothetical protein
MVVENRVPYVHIEFGEGVTVQLSKNFKYINGFFLSE